MSSPVDNPARFSGLQEGSLVLADISGYSAFVAQTEIDHSWAILHELLDTMVRSVEGRMDVSQVEGDAILFISGLSAGEVIECLEGTFVAFHRRLRDMKSVTTCPCTACANIGVLKLKFVVHHGKFSRQRLGAVEQLHGTDVIVAHRLLKNSVPSKEYFLVTDSVLERLPAGRRDRFHPHVEEFDIGAIRCGYEEVASLWEVAEAAERKRVPPEDAFINTEVMVDSPLPLVAELLLKPDVIQRYFFSDGVDELAGARGETLGTEYHCHHGADIVTMRIVSVGPGNELTITADKPVDIYLTTRLADCGNDRTLVARSVIWDVPPDAEAAEEFRKVIEHVALAGNEAIKEVFADGASAYLGAHAQRSAAGTEEHA